MDITSSQMEIGGKSVHYEAAGPEDALAILLMHGASFSAQTWVDLGTLRHLGEKGFRAVAVDCPGYGKSEAAQVTAEEFVPGVIEALGLDRPVILAASMSGTFAFPVLHERPELIRGFVGIAPALTESYAPKLTGCQVPSLILWGSADTIFDVSRADLLEKSLVNSRKIVFDGAPHPLYLERTDEFHEALVTFIESVR